MVRGTLLAILFVTILLIAGCGDDSVVIPEPRKASPAPAWVHVAETSPAAIVLRWDDVTGDEMGFLIQRSPNSGGGFAELDTVGTDTETYTDTTVTADEWHYYRVLSYDALGRRSKISAEVGAKAVANQTPEKPHSPYPEHGRRDLEIPGILTLSWETSDPDNPTIYSDVHFGEASNALTLLRGAITGNSVTLDDTLALTRFYFWRVVTSDEHGATSLSPIWSFGTQMERVTVPAGYFFMGDCGQFHADQPERFCMQEHPINGSNPVYVERFVMDKFEVSNQLFAQFLNEMIEYKMIKVVDGQVLSIVFDTLFAEVYPDGDSSSGIEFFPAAGDSGFFAPRGGKENHPVIEISWHGAHRFAGYFGWQLPTEAQWEKAARGTLDVLGDTLFTVEDQPITVGLGYPYPWGAEAKANQFNYWGSGDPFESRVAVATTPVGFFDGNSHSGYATRSNGSIYGVFDMAGNIAEWCQDDFHPCGGGTYGGMKILKGGGWRSSTRECQTFWRQEVLPDSTDNLIGFRTVLPPE
jgi:formylglycine-generating enzyme required for sulfatase activity